MSPHVERPVPTTRIAVAGSPGNTVHYPFPGDSAPLCGDVKSPTRRVPAAPGENLCLKCKSKGAKHFGW